MERSISEFRFAAIKILQRFNLILSREKLQEVCKEVMKKGVSEVEKFTVTSRKSESLIRKCNIKYERKGFRDFQLSMNRVTGFGYFFTMFFSRFRNSSPNQADLIGHLGAMANLILSFYDFFIDQKLMNHISERIFLNLLRADVKRVNTIYRKIRATGVNPFHRLIILWTEYFGEKAVMLFHDHEYKDFLNYTGDAVKLQNKLTGKQIPDREEIFEKSIRAFTILFYIALCGDDERIDHDPATISWINSLGTLFGTIDDLTDFESDEKNKDHNLILEHFSKSGGPDDFAVFFEQILADVFLPDIWLRNQSEGWIIPGCLNSWISIWDEYYHS